jgi:hypothetical protein
MQISDLSGRLIITKQLNNTLESINITALRQGCYLVNIISEKNNNTFKLIKE